MQKTLSYLFIITLLINTSSFAQTNSIVWQEDSFEDFSDGKLDASGQDIYISKDGKIRTIHCFDLNQDGYLDIFFGNNHDDESLLAPTECTVTKDRNIKQKKMAVWGSDSVATADLNRDGYYDLVFNLCRDGLQTPRKFIRTLYGSKEGFTSRRSNGLLPTYDSIALAIVDLNADKWPDIAVINTSSLLNRVAAPENNICIYWGSENGFSLFDYLEINVPNAKWLASGNFDNKNGNDLAVLTSDGNIKICWSKPYKTSQPQIENTKISLGCNQVNALSAGDCDSDGYQDLVIGTKQNKIYVIYGQSGRHWHKKKQFSAFPASDISIVDIDGDGYSDLTLTYFAIGEAGGGQMTGSAEKSKVQILWGKDGKFTQNDSTNIEVDNAYAAAVGDFDNDGRKDIAIAVFQGEKTFESESVIYFGAGDRKFERSQKTINTAGATDVLALPSENGQPQRIVFSNSIGGSLYEKVPMYLYWGSADGFKENKRLEIPAQSGYEASAADLNADGYCDIIVGYTTHGGIATLENPMVGANIFWGSADGFDFQKRYTNLHEPWILNTNIGDLNKDGYLDIVVGEASPWFGEEKGRPANLKIYYGSKDGFNVKNKVELESKKGAFAPTIADFNKDNWLDIAVATQMGNCIRIFWGSANGFNDKQDLFTVMPLGVESADLNADGYLDLIAGNFQDRHKGFFDVGSLIFWGSDKGFRYWDSQLLPAYCPVFSAVADFDNDGHLDIFLPGYQGQLNREKVPSYFYWGSANGFSPTAKTVIIGDSVQDAQTGDFDGDGLIDIALPFHTVYGSHNIDSRVLYNDGNRFENPKIVRLPTLGAHSMWMEDMGHIYNRKNIQSYESSVFQWDSSVKSGRLSFEAEVPEGSKLVFNVRSSDKKDTISKQQWRAVDSDGFTLNSNDRYLQYKAEFISNNGARYPVLDQVNIALTQ